MVIHLNQKSYNNIQSSRILFNWMCKKPWGTHTHTKTWNKLERSRVLSHSFTTDANATLLFEMRVCFNEWHCSSWPSRVVRDYLIIFRILDSVSSLTIICLEYGLGYTILLLFILYKLSCQSSSLYIKIERVPRSVFGFTLKTPATIFPFNHM